MELKMPSGFLSILKESFHVFSRNVKAMTFFSLFVPTIYSVLYLTNIFSIRPLIRDFIIMNPISFSPDAASSSHSALWWLIAVLSIAADLFFVLATVLASAVTYTRDKNLPLKELLLRTWRSSWIRPFMTVSSTTLIFGCYIFFSMLLMIPLVLFFMDNLKVFYAGCVVIAIVAVLIGTYIYVILHMAYVVSILEETSGFGAVKRAREVVKGMELHGFVMNLLLVLGLAVYLGMWLVHNIRDQSEVTRVVIGFIVLISSRMVSLFGRLVHNIRDQSEVTRVVIGFIVLISLRMVSLFGLVAYTVLYYKCKKSRGEGIEFPSIEYSKVESLPLTV